MCSTERVKRVLVLNKTDLQWCTGTENDKKLRKNMGGSRGRGAGVDGQPPSFRTAQQKNIPKYNAWKNIRKYVGPQEMEKTNVDNIFPWRNLLRKRAAHYELCALIITSKSQETIVELRRGYTPVSNFLRKSVINTYILNGKKFQVQHLPISCLTDSGTQKWGSLRG